MISNLKLFIFNPVYFKHKILGFAKKTFYNLLLINKVSIKGKIFDSRFNLLYRTDKKKRFVVEKDCCFDGSVFNNNITILEDGFCHIKKNCYINGVTIVSNKKIIIGKDSTIGFGTRIIDSNIHPINGEVKEGEIIIGKKVWISSDVTILRGVKIGENSVVGTRTLVNKNIPPNSLAFGSPMKIIKDYIKK
jgi:acetyltransferase-like isoleucine patch superfamily enzyme